MMNNNQTSSGSPNTIQEVLGQMFGGAPATPPPTTPNRPLTVEQILEDCFLGDMELQPRTCLRREMNRSPVPRVVADDGLHYKPPGPGASFGKWKRFLRREAKKMKSSLGNRKPVPFEIFVRIVQKFTKEDKTSFVDFYNRLANHPEHWNR